MIFVEITECSVSKRTDIRGVKSWPSVDNTFRPCEDGYTGGYHLDLFQREVPSHRGRIYGTLRPVRYGGVRSVPERTDIRHHGYLVISSAQFRPCEDGYTGEIDEKKDSQRVPFLRGRIYGNRVRDQIIPKRSVPGRTDIRRCPTASRSRLSFRPWADGYMGRCSHENAGTGAFRL